MTASPKRSLKKARVFGRRGLALTPEELHGIPEADRATWRQVWAEVTTLLKKVTNARPPSA
jgi:hypothetical protein